MSAFQARADDDGCPLDWCCDAVTSYVTLREVLAEGKRTGGFRSLSMAWRTSGFRRPLATDCLSACSERLAGAGLRVRRIGSIARAIIRGLPMHSLVEAFSSIGCDRLRDRFVYGFRCRSG